MRTRAASKVRPAQSPRIDHFCTVTPWKDGEIVEEKLFYDLVGLTKQIVVM